MFPSGFYLHQCYIPCYLLSMLSVNSRIQIPEREFKFSFSRSSGSGGQNVNKVNTKVTLHWDVEDSPSISEALRQRFIKRFASRISQEGEVVISSSRSREQARNKAQCLEKLKAMILEVASPAKKRIPTKIKKSAVERRLKDKKMKARTKERRKKPKED